MSAAIIVLLNNPQRLAEARVAARERAKSFTWIRAARQTLVAYESAIASRGKNGESLPRKETSESGELVSK